jgi:hypothetical protein
MPDDRYSDDNPPRRDDEYDRGRRDDDYDRGGRYDDDRDFRRGGEDIPNYLAQAVLVTLCCCLPFGVVAIVNASKVNTHIQAGDYRAAREASDEAKKWAMIGFVCGLIIQPLALALNIMANSR